MSCSDVGRYCDDCPDREACGQGAPCELVRRHAGVVTRGDADPTQGGAPTGGAAGRFPT